VFLKKPGTSTSWNVRARGTFWRSFQRKKIKDKKRKGWNFFLLERAGRGEARRGGAGRDKKEVRGEGEESGGQGGGGPLKMRHLFHLCLSSLLPAAVATNANQHNPKTTKKTKKQSSTKNSSSNSSSSSSSSSFRPPLLWLQSKSFAF